MELLIHALTHALEDSVRMLPFLFAAYWVIEYVEHRHSEGIERVLAGGGRFGFVPGALLGCFPQCGFSAMAANFYASKVVTLGTLLAVFLTTSDEAVPLMIAHPGNWHSLLAMMGIKLAVALAVGFCVDFPLRRWIPASVRGGYSGRSQDVDCHEHKEQDGIVLAAVKHTVHIWGYIVLFSFVLGLIVELVGEDSIGAFLAQAGPVQPLLAGLIGLVPNCVSSILLTQLFVAGQLSFGGVVAGLCTSAGVGLAVLFRVNRSIRQNLFIVGLLYAVGVGAGYLCTLFTWI